MAHNLHKKIALTFGCMRKSNSMKLLKEPVGTKTGMGFPVCVIILLVWSLGYE